MLHLTHAHVLFHSCPCTMRLAFLIRLYLSSLRAPWTPWPCWTNARERPGRLPAAGGHHRALTITSHSLTLPSSHHSITPPYLHPITLITSPHYPGTSWRRSSDRPTASGWRISAGLASSRARPVGPTTKHSHSPTSPEGRGRGKRDVLCYDNHNMTQRLPFHLLSSQRFSFPLSRVCLLSSPTTLVCRSVGIGAYLNRLGQRVIQMQQGPMILTGFSALNKLLGKEVYTSQDQLGGPQVRH